MTEKTPSNAPLDDEADAIAALFTRFASGLAGAVRGIVGARGDPGEIIQEAYLKALKAIRGGTVPRDHKAWIFVVTMSVARDSLRKRLRRGDFVALEEVNPMTLQAKQRAPERGLENQEVVAAARDAINQLKERQKEVFLLRVSAGLEFAAIADALEIPVGTAKTRMRQALLNLKNCLASSDASLNRGKETA